MADLPRTPQHIEGFALGRLIAPVAFELRSAGPQEGQYDPRPRYPDGTLVSAGFKSGTNRGRPKGTVLGIGHTADTKAEMVRRYRAGEGLHPLAAAFSTTAQRVREIVIQAGVEIRQAGYCRKEKGQRSDDMAKLVEIQPEQIREIHARYMAGERLADCVAGRDISVSTAINRFKGMGLEYPRPATVVTGLPPRLARSAEPPHLTDLVAEADTGPGDEAMDDPTPDAAVAHVQTEPATEAVVQQAWKEMQERARQLRERVIAVQDLPPVTLRPCSPPAVVFDALLAEMVNERNVFAVAHAVKGMVDKMQTIPGVTARFQFGYELMAGVRP